MKRKRKRKVFSGLFFVSYPDKPDEKVVLPSVKGVKLGGLYNSMLIYKGHFVLVWWKRVKGGWEHVEVRDVQQG